MLGRDLASCHHHLQNVREATSEDWPVRDRPLGQTSLQMDELYQMVGMSECSKCTKVSLTSLFTFASDHIQTDRDIPLANPFVVHLEFWSQKGGYPRQDRFLDSKSCLS